jgi:lysophospholipase L1-like esterase
LLSAEEPLQVLGGAVHPSATEKGETMKRRITTCLAALLCCLTALVSAGPARAETTTPPDQSRYAALGDSYSAGYGAGDYLTDEASLRCARSRNAYPMLLSDADSRLDNVEFVACSGAYTADLVAGQLDVLDSYTRVVTLTIGGNDAGFTVLLGCLQNGTCSDNQAALQARVDAGLKALAGSKAYTAEGGRKVTSLVKVISAIHARAPKADIFLAGYPELFGYQKTCPVSAASRLWVNTQTERLNVVIAASALASRLKGIDATYVGVVAGFDGHGVCDRSSSWVATDVMHPTQTGQGAYAKAFIAKGVTK